MASNFRGQAGFVFSFLDRIYRTFLAFSVSACPPREALRTGEKAEERLSGQSCLNSPLAFHLLILSIGCEPFCLWCSQFAFFRFESQRDLSSCLDRFINSANQFEGFSSFKTID